MQHKAPQSDKNKKYKASRLLGRLITEELPAHKKRLVIAIFCMIIAAMTTAATAGLIDPAIKEIFLEKDTELLLTLPLIIIAVSVLRGITTFGQSTLMSTIGMYVVNNLQKKMYRKLLRLDMEWISRKHSGQIVSSFVNDAMAMRDAASNIIVALIKESLTLIGCCAIMFYQDWLLASLTIFIFLPVAVIIKKLMKKSSKSARGVFDETGNLSSHIAETVKGMRILRVYGQEDHEAKRAEHTFSRRLKYLLQEVRARAASSPITEAMTGIGIAAAIYYAGSRGIEGQMDVNNFMSFFAAMMMAYQPGRALSGLATKIQSGLVAAERVYTMLDLDITIHAPENPEILQHCQGEIFFDDISFCYNQKDIILKDLTLQIKSGEKIALVGPSGSGKSTLLNLLPRFYDPTSGHIYIDGIDIKKMTPDHLRQHIALVSQDAFLFNGTVRENIAYGNNKATEQDIIRVAKEAAAYDFIMSLPEQFETQVGEGGSLLSGGQKQRIAIARAFLKDAPILLLDEATSALDNESEAFIQETLKKLMQGRTTLIIAHRLSTVVDCDRIIVIEDHNISGDGTHQQLLAFHSLYQRLYKLSEE
ncbi:MAG: ABC transporter ATP-binding protein [Pseudomonadota bacterium]